jgi:hypothetical protein
MSEGERGTAAHVSADTTERVETSEEITAEDASEARLQPGRRIVLYTLVVAALSMIAFVGLILITPLPAATENAETGSASMARIFIMNVAIMLFAGAVGGSLYNIRGLTKHSGDNDFDERYNLTYYLAPFAGAISGVVVFFLLLGGALTLSLTPADGNVPPSWTTLIGRMPYIAFSLLAGYSSREFMLKAKEVAVTVFSVRE